MNYGIVLDLAFTDHAVPAGHPERPDRIRSIVNSMESWPRLGQLSRFAPRPAQEEWIEAAHGPRHVRRIKETRGRPHLQLDPDTHTGPHSYEVALLAAGSAVDLTERLLQGQIDSGFVLARPPGHHAESAKAMGFCLFNNVAVAAHWALSQKGLERVAVVDFDVHHGNGTQEIFYSRGDVFYISTHQHPLYPGTGAFRERGEGEGQGRTLNFPMPAGCGNDFYLSLFDDLLIPQLLEYRPELVLVSAGFDAHAADPLAGMKVTEDGFAQICARLNRAARQACGGRILYLLEGGYDLQALASSVRSSIEASLDALEPQAAEPPRGYAGYAARARRELGL